MPHLFSYNGPRLFVLLLVVLFVSTTSRAMSIRMSDASPDELAEMAERFKGQKPVTEVEVAKFFNSMALADGKGDPNKPAFTEDERESLAEDDRTNYLLLKILMALEYIEAKDPGRRDELNKKLPPSLRPTRKEIAIVKKHADAFMKESGRD